MAAAQPTTGGTRGPICDDFEYPVPQRETLWTLPDKKRALRPSLRESSQSPARHPCRTDDISGAQHGTTHNYVLTKKFTHKPDLFASAPTAIQGATPKRQIPLEPLRGNHIQDKSLRTDDLGPGCRSEVKGIKTTRGVNPLNPVYQLPTGAETQLSTVQDMLKASGSPLKASAMNMISHSMAMQAEHNGAASSSSPARDPLRLDDIVGTRAADAKGNTRIRLEKTARDNIGYGDVPFSTADSKSKLRKRDSPSKALETKDICHNDVHTITTNRCNNPLEPEYTVIGPQNKLMKIGRVEGSSPKPTPKQRTDRPSMILSCHDIEGARPLKRFE